MADILFTKLYIQTDLGPDLIILDNVYHMARGERLIYTGTYRNAAAPPGKAVVWPSGTEATGADNDFANYASEVPVIGDPSITPTAVAWTALKHIASDEALGIPHRFRRSLESGLLFSLADVAIAAPPSPPFLSVPFTVNITTNVCTAGAAHGLVTGDTGAVSAATTLAAPLLAPSLYSVIKVSATEFMLLTSAGAVVDFSSVGTGQQVFNLVTSASPPADVDGAITFVPFVWNPRLSTTDPRD